MGRQIWLLTKVSLRNLFGLNEFRFTKDKKKKSRYYLMGTVGCLVILMVIFYVGMISYGIIAMGAGEVLPALLAMCVSFIVFLFTMTKAGAELFDNRVFEKQIVLPVKVEAILASRFFVMYLTNMLVGILVMAPGMAVYGVMEGPEVTFYLYGIVGSLFLPLLPLLAATVAGVLIAGIGSRWKNRLGKNLVMIVLTLLLVGVIVAGSMGMSQTEESELEAMLRQLVPMLGEQISGIYPPALWLSEAMTEGKISWLLLFAALPVGECFIFFKILSPFYSKICSLLNNSGTTSKEGYARKDMMAKSPLRSMTERELRRYFSSVVYVVNTMVGEMMMVFLAIGVGIMGKDVVDTIFGIEGIAERILPVLLGVLPAVMPMTASSISMEGKEWWMMQVFPVREKVLLRSKVLANLLVVFPFYLVSELVLLFTMQPDVGNAISLLAVPAAYIIFGARVGLAINSRFPIFDWESETRVVKQSAAVSLMLLVGMVSGVIPMAVLVGAREIPAEAVYAVTVGGMAGVILCITKIFSVGKSGEV